MELHMERMKMDVSPELFINGVVAYQKTAALKAAVGLDLFTAIGEGAAGVETLARRTGANTHGVRILCDYLTVEGILQKTNQQYALTPSSEVFLNRGSPAYMGDVIEFLASPELIKLFLDDPASYVRNGGSVGLANVAPNNPIWVKFAEAMTSFVAPTAEGLATQAAALPRPPRKILEIAAGHGIFGIAMAKALSQAEVTAVDWENVLAVAKRNAERAGVTARYRPVAGSAFEVDWGGGYDLVLLPNFLHHFDQETCTRLMKKVRASLTPQGCAWAVEFVPNEDRVSPPFPAIFAFIMLGSTPHGDAYTPSAFVEMGRAAGFRDIGITPLPPSPQSLVAFAP
jgi:2-polyprenyl-3-methyl-5-hydroxy-6-metoxy-1,4-benzoquinol methylase